MTPKIEYGASICPNCGKYVNGVNPHDDGETWRE